MPRRALLFDLDDTLMVEEPAAQAAFLATARLAAAERELDPERLARDARSRARELWHAAPTHPYCKRVGISSWEGLWCRFEGEGSDERSLREWAPAYRREAWRLGLGDQGVEDEGLAARLGERFGEERRARHEAFADADEALADLARTHRLALVTNGAACLQREKLAASGLAERFEAVVVSADLDAAKPEPAVFRRALDGLGVAPAEAAMVGDSIRKDIDGALALGMGAIWLNRTGAPTPEGRDDLIEISTLAELAAALERLPSADSRPL